MHGVHFLQHPFETKVPHDKDCSPHRKLPHRKVEILIYLNDFFLIFIMQVITELYTFQEVTGELVLDFYSEIP